MLLRYAFEKHHDRTPTEISYRQIGPMESASADFVSSERKKLVVKLLGADNKEDAVADRTRRILDASQYREILSKPAPPQSDVIAFSDNKENSVYFRQNEIIIGFWRRSPRDISLISSKLGLGLKWFDAHGLFGLFRIRRGSLRMAVEALMSIAEVRYAHPNVLVGSEELEFSDLESDGPGLPRSPLWNHELIRRRGNWSQEDGRGITIGVIDTPISSRHPGFRGALLDSSAHHHFGKGTPAPQAHGTRVCSILLDRTMTDFGQTVGLAPAANLISVSIDTDSTSSYADRARAVNFLARIAAQRRADLSDGRQSPVPRLLVNCSWKVEGTQDLTAVRESFEALSRAGALCICSAGNSGSDAPHYPSDYSSCISVAGLTRNQTKSPRSNFGNGVDFCMPGGDGTPYSEDDIIAACGDGLFDYSSGTSFAAPHATAMLAVHWSRNPKLPAHELLSLVESRFAQSVSKSNPTLVGMLGAGLICFNS